MDKPPTFTFKCGHNNVCAESNAAVKICPICNK